MSAKRRKRRRKSTGNHGLKNAEKRLPTSRGWRAVLRPHAPSIIVFVVALGIRLLYLWQASDSPSFLMPLVDSEIYDRAARGFAAGDGFGESFFYQPFFYPFFLGLVYAISGSSIVVAKIVQAAIGAASCALVCGLSSRIHDHRTGIVAGFMTAAYGPLMFFDGELLATGWACLWSVVLVWLFIAAAERQETWLLAAVGCCSGLAVLTRPTFLPFVVAAALWLLWTVGRRERSALARAVVLMVAGFALVVLPVAWLCHGTTGRFAFLPASGGLNLHIGNNPVPCETLTTRPGQDWRDLVTQPARAGADGVWETDRYFRDRFNEFVEDDPVAFVTGVGVKSLMFVSSREIPRNLDMYMFRPSSSVLWMSVWKVGGFGFPFGVLLPLAALGLIVGWRRLPVPVLLFLALYPLAVIAVFVSARYRVPVVPVVTLVAAAGVVWLIDTLRAGRVKHVALAAAVLVSVLAVAVIPGPFCQEEDLSGEHWFLVAAAELRNGDRQQAVQSMRRAVEFEPGYFEARYQLGSLLLEMGEVAEAAVHLERAVAERPDFALGHRELGTAYGRLGRLDDARIQLEQALTILPDDIRTLNSLGALSAREGDLVTARSLFERALAIDPDFDAARENLRYVNRELGNPTGG